MEVSITLQSTEWPWQLPAEEWQVVEVLRAMYEDAVFNDVEYHVSTSVETRTNEDGDVVIAPYFRHIDIDAEVVANER